MDRVIYKKEKLQSDTQTNLVPSSLLNNLPAKIFFIIISAILFYNVFHSVKITVQKLDILKKARIEVESLRFKNLELALLLDDMQTLEYVEIQARDRLNFGSKNEYVFVIPKDALNEAKSSLDTILSERSSTPMKKSYEVWFDFVSNGI
ncbi:MAG: septum formation initiator family protein [Candidatus Dojkabacteria bacterium]